jgi:hypothetical protein
MLKTMSDITDRIVDEINGMVDKMAQIINSNSESIVKIETYEDEPSPIYWLPQQYQAEPPPPKNFNVQSIAKLEAQVELIADILNRRGIELSKSAGGQS